MGCASFIRGLALFCQTGVAAAVIAITILHLAKYNVQTDISQPVQEQCVLGSTSLFGGMSWCTANYIVAGASIGATIALSFLMCITCNLCGAGPVLDLLFAATGVAWWTVTGIALNTSQNTLNATNAPAHNWRMTIVYLYWAAMALFAVTALAALIEILDKICGCCCSCCSCGSSRKGHRDVEKGRPSYVVGKAPQQQQFLYG